MENILKLDTYGHIISNNELGEKIYTQINLSLLKNEKLLIDFANIKSMATYNAKQIFGQLYLNLGAEDFFKKIIIKNASPSILAIIKLGITDSLKVKSFA